MGIVHIVLCNFTNFKLKFLLKRQVFEYIFWAFFCPQQNFNVGLFTEKLKRGKSLQNGNLFNFYKKAEAEALIISNEKYSWNISALTEISLEMLVSEFFFFFFFVRWKITLSDFRPYSSNFLSCDL
jgi:hypothetical protein